MENFKILLLSQLVFFNQTFCECYLLQSSQELAIGIL